MARNRFLDITRVLRFDDAAARRQKRSDDKLQPIRECFQMWVETLADCYVPGECMTVDEQLVTFRGRCPFKQYLPSKPGKYGLKIWTLCDSKTSYVQNMQVYTGKRPGQPREEHLGEKVVMELTEGIYRSGRNITCDNFFTSLDLARKLLAKKLTLVGTIRKNRKELPLELVSPQNREVYSTLFGFQDNAMIASYCPRKNKTVTMLSTMHSQATVQTDNQKKPEIILYYNSTKGGVDTLDQMVRTYSTKCMTRRWPMSLFYNMIDVSCVNAFVIWMTLNPDWCAGKANRRKLFLTMLGKALIALSEPTVRVPAAALAQNSGEPSRKRGQCCKCPQNKDRRSHTTCDVCRRHICQEHQHVFCGDCIQVV